MKRIATLSFILTITLTLTAQMVDVITGETIIPEYMDQFRNDPEIRARYNNNPFDDNPYTNLKGELPYVTGEIMNPDVVAVDDLNKHRVVVKEYAPEGPEGEAAFGGAFLYEGYALADLLQNFLIKKKNKGAFGLNTDLFVFVENRKGESAVFSWGELFFSKRGKDIILATRVYPVFPTNSSDRWPVPEEMKIVAANDFMTVRNIKNPSRIVIRSFPREFPGTRGTRPLYAPELAIHLEDEKIVVMDKIPGRNLQESDYQSVFFGLHMGFRGVEEFRGIPLADVLREFRSFTTGDLQHGLFAVGAKDGYRVTFSLSEILNRNTAEQPLVIDAGKSDDGRFIINPGADFFADRHLKGARLAYIIIVED